MTMRTRTPERPIFTSEEPDQSRLDQATVLLGAVLGVVVISLLCISLVSSVQDFMFGNTRWNGMSDFTKKYESTSLHGFDQLPPQPSATALLIIPQVPANDTDLAALHDYVNRGGRLVLLDDYRYGNRILEYLGIPVRFSGSPLVDPLFCFRNPSLPRITEFSADLTAAGVRSVVLNHPTALSDADARFVMAWSSVESYIDDGNTDRDGMPVRKGSFPVAARYPLGKGEVVVVADSSIGINSMIDKDDNEAFLREILIKGIGPGNTYVDYTYLERKPLDEAKRGIERTRLVLDQPQYFIPLLLIIFAAVGRYFLWPRSKKPVEEPAGRRRNRMGRTNHD